MALRYLTYLTENSSRLLFVCKSLLLLRAVQDMVILFLCITDSVLGLHISSCECISHPPAPHPIQLVQVRGNRHTRARVQSGKIRLEGLAMTIVARRGSAWDCVIRSVLVLPHYTLVIHPAIPCSWLARRPTKNLLLLCRDEHLKVNKEPKSWGFSCFPDPITILYNSLFTLDPFVPSCLHRVLCTNQFFSAP